MIKFQKASKHDIHIQHTINGGMIVKIGCAKLSFSDYETMMDAMAEYYRDPDEVVKVYNSTTGYDIEDCSETRAQEKTPNPHYRRALRETTRPSDQNEESLDELR